MRDFSWKQNKLFTLIALVLSLFLACATSAFADYVPPKPVGYVNDFAKVISSDDFVKLDNIIQQLKLPASQKHSLFVLNDFYYFYDMIQNIVKHVLMHASMRQWCDCKV